MFLVIRRKSTEMKFGNFLNRSRKQDMFNKTYFNNWFNNNYEVNSNNKIKAIR